MFFSLEGRTVRMAAIEDIRTCILPPLKDCTSTIIYLFLVKISILSEATPGTNREQLTARLLYNPLTSQTKIKADEPSR